MALRNIGRKREFAGTAAAGWSAAAAVGSAGPARRGSRYCRRASAESKPGNRGAARHFYTVNTVNPGAPAVCL